VQSEIQSRDDTEVTAAAADRPEQVLVPAGPSSSTSPSAVTICAPIWSSSQLRAGSSTWTRRSKAALPLMRMASPFWNWLESTIVRPVSKRASWMR